ncbi:SAICAR synthase-like protein [Neurospora crassa]|uniref:PIPK domain-containing protein n=1 Tax=Neurospora crassa (strain ATCC 24698 / 74-OR23-1A / CBS 708.71 / DSM 1257 / FGSC 987) TaxID=367110 RepID=U9W8Y7_NEUCR|nr:hypothetical protein NCU16699 [Neurospora crassa OR74A]ESA43440.1 hypothetical protein NCU16699 [Neurospora crassa OR74A]KHE86770.1 SAICAR synthase-like protein [Neurospora crassa]|eukprot:XP_011394064.1 hypothetical protein NCU16699 [Neurospora crassa OR74A]
MGRSKAIARSIARAITGTSGLAKRRSSNSNPLRLILSLFSLFFSIHQLILQKIRPADFANLRRNHWDVEDNDYYDSFQPPQDGDKPEESLTSIGDMGFSGSTFYSTKDQKYLVKSVPRHSEHSFFRQDLLTPYVEYMATHPRSLLVRICDFLGASGYSIGRILRLAPSHHIVMENIMYGRGRSESQKRGDVDVDWEDWDLKPTSYFYPERDIADGALTSEATKSQLADEFHDKIRLSKEQADEFFRCLEEDTRLLAEHGAVDYSLFLVRMQTTASTSTPSGSGQGQGNRPDPAAAPSSSEAVLEEVAPPTEGPSVPPGPPSWRTGIASADGKYIYRASILDFFWAKHKLQPMVMTVLIKLWNLLISKQGPMSITTTPEEYRQRFLKMCRSYVEVVGELSVE